jgi:hypothetical protein
MSELKHIEGHLDERRAEAREHLAQHFEEAARRLRSSDIEPVGVAAMALYEDGTRDVELCCGQGLDALALAAVLQTLARSLADEE